MASVVDICNLALQRIGQTKPIAAIDEQSKAAEVCAQVYDLCLDTVLADYPWPFATSWKRLALMSDPPTNWQYRYSYPANCIKLRFIVVPGVRRPVPDDAPSYELQFYNDQQTIVTDTEDAEVVYTARVSDPSLYSSSFVDALAWRLAQEIAMPMTVDENKMDNARKMYEGMVSRAADQALNEVKRDKNPETEFVTVRN